MVVVFYGFETTSDFVPPKLELPFTAETVNVTDPTRFGMPDFETEHWPLAFVVHVPLPVVPLLHDHATVAPESGEPLSVTVIVTFAVHFEPLLALEPASATLTPVPGELTVTFCDALPVAPALSVTVSVTAYVPPAAYVCEGSSAVELAPSPKVHA